MARFYGKILNTKYRFDMYYFVNQSPYASEQMIDMLFAVSIVRAHHSQNKEKHIFSRTQSSYVILKPFVVRGSVVFFHI